MCMWGGGDKEICIKLYLLFVYRKTSQHTSDIVCKTRSYGNSEAQFGSYSHSLDLTFLYKMMGYSDFKSFPDSFHTLYYIVLYLPPVLNTTSYDGA